MYNLNFIKAISYDNDSHNIIRIFNIYITQVPSKTGFDKFHYSITTYTIDIGIIPNNIVSILF